MHEEFVYSIQVIDEDGKITGTKGAVIVPAREYRLAESVESCRVGMVISEATMENHAGYMLADDVIFYTTLHSEHYAPSLIRTKERGWVKHKGTMKSGQVIFFWERVL